MRHFCYAAAILTVAAIFVGAFSMAKEAYDPITQNPQDRFLGLVRSRFRATDAEIKTAFKNCFREGETIEGFDRIRASAHKRIDHENGEVEYWWFVPDMPEGQISHLYLVVIGRPPYVVKAHWVVWDS